MLLRILIFIAIIILIAILTAILFGRLNKLFGWLSSKIIKTKKDDGLDTTSGDSLKTTLNTLLATSIGILSLVLSFQGTLLDPEFVTAELQKLDMPTVASELLGGQSSDKITAFLNKIPTDEIPVSLAELSQEQIYGAESIEATVRELWPVLGKEVNEAVSNVYKYFLGEQQNLEVVIPLDEVRSTLEDNLKKEVLKSPPDELESAPREQIQSYAERVFLEEFEHVPDALRLSSDTVVKNLSLSFHEIRAVTVFIPKIPVILLGFIILLAIGVIIANRNFKLIFWNLGITLVVSTLLGQLYILSLKELGNRVTSLTLLPAFNLWVIEVATDVLIFLNGIFEFTLYLGIGMVAVSLLVMLGQRLFKPRLANRAASA
jgi:hypothetical protein